MNTGDGGQSLYYIHKMGFFSGFTGHIHHWPNTENLYQKSFYILEGSLYLT